MAGWDDLSFWQTPIAVGDPSRAQVAGYDELGRPTLRGFDGRVYSLPLPETATYPDWLNDATASMDPLGRGINEDRPSRGENALAAISALTRNPLAAVPDVTGPTTYGDAFGTAMGMATGGAGSVAPEGALGIFAGRRARTADLDALARAEAMEQAGSFADEVSDATGWFRGRDGDWRFEIDDSGSHVRNLSAPDVESAFYHPALFEAYPELAPVRFDHRDQQGYLGYVDFPGQGLPPTHLNVSPRNTDPRSTILHELQHGVQGIEGFATGGNHTTSVAAELAAIQRRQGEIYSSGAWDEFDAWRNSPDGRAVERRAGSYNAFMRTPEVQALIARSPGLQEAETLRATERALKDRGSQDYHRLSGEVEARHVQARRDMTAAERADQHPHFGMDVPWEEQIVTRGGPTGAQMDALRRYISGL